MKYGKLIEDKLELAPKIVSWHGRTVLNPSAEKLAELGYKPVRYTEPEGEAPEGFIWAEVWTETGEAIVQGWELAPEGDIPAEEALGILLGGAE